MDTIFERYMEICLMDDSMEKLAALMECAEQEEDESICREARYKVGIMFWNGDGTEENKEAARELIHSSAEMGFIKAMEFMIPILKAEGAMETAAKYEDYIGKNKLSEEEIAKLQDNIIRILGDLIKPLDI